MCILSLFRNDKEFILTHNRDEDFKRKSSEKLVVKTWNGIEAIFPEDVQAGGTWILTSNKWTTAILNGAEHFHNRNPPYRHSRGIFPFLLLEYDEIEVFWENVNLEEIEPFTQIVINHINNDAFDLKWDGKQKLFRKISENFFVTSSATLYSISEKQLHQKTLQKLSPITPDNLSHVHQKLHWKYKSDLPMIKTTSTTQIQRNSEFCSVKYERW
ncbi:MAG: NRDE family protein [Flavobacteriaceae bacterium]|nr:NRDE family protein [Flavobacteriaceae bacterium]